MAKNKRDQKRAPSLPRKATDLRQARLHELDRDQRSILVYLALPRERAIALLKRLNLTMTGYRPEGLGDIERSDLIADELASYPEHQKTILQALERELGTLPDTEASLGPAAIHLAPFFAQEAGAAKAIARMLLDTDRDVRQAGIDLLDALADFYLGEPPEEGEPPAEALPSPGAPGPDPTEPLRRELSRARERAEAAERERTATADQLQEARREAAETQVALGEIRRARAAAEAERDRLRANLDALSSGHSPVEQRLRRENDEQRDRIARLEEERRVLRIEKARLEARDRAAPAERPAPEPPKPPLAGEEETIEEAPASWLMPVFTKEYYDSLSGWERRLQRLAFVKAMMLAQDHRHPSLRAIPLEGLPNLYRIRIATDVRLLYRRGEGNVIEILRLIDREDLDRWIKVEKSRT